MHAPFKLIVDFLRIVAGGAFMRRYLYMEKLAAATCVTEAREVRINTGK